MSIYDNDRFLESLKRRRDALADYKRMHADIFEYLKKTYPAEEVFVKGVYVKLRNILYTRGNTLDTQIENVERQRGIE